MRNDVVRAVRQTCVFAGIVVFGSQPIPAQQVTPAVNSGGRIASETERLVQKQVDAYNRHDLDAFLNCYSADIKLYEFPDKPIGSGLDSMREKYGRLFRDVPDLKVEIAERIVQGDTVIDHESGSSKSRKFTAVAIYKVKEGKIVGVWFVR